MSAGLNALASKFDFCEAEDRDDIAESIEEVRGMMRCVGRSPGADSTELTEEDAERSGSGAPVGLETFVSPAPATMPVGPTPAMSGDWDVGWEAFGGGAGKGALAIREMGERFWAGEGLALDLGESGLWETGESFCRYDCCRELVCKGDGEIWRVPGGPGRDAMSDRAPK